MSISSVVKELENYYTTEKNTITVWKSIANFKL